MEQITWISLALHTFLSCCACGDDAIMELTAGNDGIMQ